MNRIFTVCFLGPRSDILHALQSIIKTKKIAFWQITDNRLLMAISWLGVYLVATSIVDIMQSIFGVSIGRIEFENYLVEFVQLTAAPLSEELGFRVLLIGLPMLLFLGNISTAKDFFGFLWHPGRYSSKVNRKILAIIAFSALFFGISHITVSSGWEYGKITQAAMGGMVLGWVYYRNGFPAALFIHWASNYGIFAHGFLGYALFGYEWFSSEQNLILGFLEVILTLIGVLVIIFYSYNFLRSRQTTLAK